MKISGWIFLVLGWGFVLTLAVYCYYRLLVHKSKKKKDFKEKTS